MNPDQIILAFVAGSIGRIIQNVGRVHFYRLHVAWLVPVALAFFMSSKLIVVTTIDQVPFLNSCCAIINYASMAILVILLFPVDIKSDKTEYFSFTRYAVGFKNLFFILQIVHQLTYIIALSFCFDQLDKWFYSFLVTGMMIVMYLLCIYSKEDKVHWTAFLITILGNLYFLILAASLKMGM